MGHSNHIIRDRYRIGHEIGKGGMGTVFEGTDTQTGNAVAIKLLNPAVVQRDPEMLERFRREGEALRNLNHPNIVKMLDALQDGDNNYLVLEYVSGGDLNDLIKEQQLPVKRILKMAIDLADALTRAHKLDIIHRDLKPANVLVAEDGTLRLTDFGVARIAGERRVTATENIVGTLDYLPPEALKGQAIDSRADIWAFGVILFEMLAGERPFRGLDIAAVITSILNDPVPDLEELRPDTPLALVDLVYRMLTKDQQERISSVRHVGAALDDLLQGRTTTGHRQVITGDSRFDTPAPPPQERPKHNLPAQTTDFVGREAELAELLRLLGDTRIRLITILGPGGMGKTRLALEVAAHVIQPQDTTPLQQAFPDGAYFVELAPLTDPANIVSAIAEATRYQFLEDERDQKQQILDYLRNKRLLLIMDNFEHLIGGAGLVTEILKAAPGVQILATSRQKLNQSGESIFNLAGMDFPKWETPADALEYAAVKLFMQSARRARPDFELEADDLPYVARISRLVYGMPLGLLLAASWLAMLSPQEIAEEIQQGLDFLESDMGDLPERHRSIRAVFDYSWNLMNEDERSVFMKLSVFRGGFSREAAQAVSGANLRTLMTLMNKSLIRRDNDTGRYEVHELLRQYAQEQLTASGEEAATRDAHSVFYAELTGQREAALKGKGQVAAVNAIDTDFENIRAAWQRAIQQRDEAAINQMIDALYWFCTFRSRFQDGLELFRQARAQWPAESDEAALVAGRLQVRFSEPVEDPLPVFERSLAIARYHQNDEEIAYCTRLIGHHLSHGNIDPAKGNRMLEESLEAYRELGDEFMAAIVLDDLSWGYGLEGMHEKRLPLAQQSVDLRRKIGDEIGTANALRNLGGARITQGSVAGALESWEEGRAMAQRLGDRANAAWCLALLVYANIAHNQLEDIDPLIEESEQIAFDIGHPVILGFARIIKGLLTGLRGEYTRALQIVEDAFPPGTQDYLREFFVHWAFIVGGVGVQDYDRVRQSVVAGLEFMLENSLRFSPVFLPGAAFLAVHAGRHERAVELIAAMTIEQEDDIHWTDSWPPMIGLRADLKRDLGEVVYDTAFARGKQWNIGALVETLMVEIAEGAG